MLLKAHRTYIKRIFFRFLFFELKIVRNFLSLALRAVYTASNSDRKRLNFVLARHFGLLWTSGRKRMDQYL